LISAATRRLLANLGLLWGHANEAVPKHEFFDEVLAVCVFPALIACRFGFIFEELD
jgi:hypothetical protein